MGLLIVSLLALQGGEAARAQQNDKAAKAEYARFLREASTYQLSRGSDAAPLHRHPEPLLNWGNPARQQERGSVFVWEQEGRPLALGSVFTYEFEGRTYDKHEFVSLSSAALEMRRGDQVVWAPAADAITWRDGPAGMVPAKNKAQRLVQMRSLARALHVSLINEEGEASELRLMSQPLYRYASPSGDVIDGAMFSYVVATDPEAILLVEAVGSTESMDWRSALARFHYWQLEATDVSGNHVWSAAADPSQAAHRIGDASQLSKTYVSFHPEPEGAN
jgi:hypothetical protein